MTKLLIMLVLLVPAGFLVWDVADAFLGDTKTEREVMGDNFLEHDRYAEAITELIDEHGAGTAVLDVHVDLRSAQFSVVTGATTAVVEGFGWRGGSNGGQGPGGSPVDDYERKVGADEVPIGSLGSLASDAPRRIVAGLERQDVGIDQVVSMRLVGGAWSILISTGPDAETDHERWSASPDGSEVRPPNS
jgi:hypothetical protein